jgi:hypothetical protein
MLAMDAHSSLLLKFVNNSRKKFYNIGPRCLYYKAYYCVFVPGKPSQPSPMFAGKAGAYPSEVSTLGSAAGLTHKH